MESTEHDLREFLGVFLRRKTQSAKDLARLIDCEPRTAEGFRAGRYWPTARHWRLIVRAFGRDVLAAVFDPEIDHVLARLTMEERQLEERLHDIRKARRSAAGALEVPEEHLQSSEDRSLDDKTPDLFEARP